jgi:DNA-directed RNA polymerase subunit beta'
MAFDAGELALGAQVTIRMTDLVPPADFEVPAGYQVGDVVDLETTLGRSLFNDALPVDYPYVNYMVDKSGLSAIVNDLAEKYPKVEVAAALDALKEAGFHWATRSGVTISFSDVVAPASKQEILNAYEAKAESVQEQYDQGLITDEERRHELIQIWTKATEEVAEAMQANFPERNTVYRMVSSGARGNWMQVRQIAGMRGLVADPKGEIIPRPIKSNYREGLSVVEYFIATHGARKGLADTALRTADSGYLTRRLVDVSQDVIVREEDCGTERGLTLPISEVGPDGKPRRHPKVETSVFARTLATDVVNAKGEVLASAGADAGDVMIDALIAAGITEV